MLKPLPGNEMQQEALVGLYKLMEKRGWPTSEQDHELCMARAREFLDYAELIYPRG